jgi:hypothetical protein
MRTLISVALALALMLASAPVMADDASGVGPAPARFHALSQMSAGERAALALLPDEQLAEVEGERLLASVLGQLYLGRSFLFQARAHLCPLAPTSRSRSRARSRGTDHRTVCSREDCVMGHIDLSHTPTRPRFLARPQLLTRLSPLLKRTLSLYSPPVCKTHLALPVCIRDYAGLG